MNGLAAKGEIPPNIVVVGQSGRLAAETVLFAASLRASDPESVPRLTVAEPQPGLLWSHDPRLDSETRGALDHLGVRVAPFDSRVFGETYTRGNKAECLTVLPEGEPFLFFDTDTLITGALSEVPIDPSRPAASMRRSGTWPKIELYGPGYTEIWRALYDRFDLEFESSLDLGYPDEYWRRYLYFNAGWFFGPCPHAFAARYTEIMQIIREDPPPELVCQPLDPWLDQIALPLVIHGLGGGRPGPELDPLDGEVSFHYRTLPLLYATATDETVAFLEEITAPNRIKRALKAYEPWKRILYQGRGRRARALFAPDERSLPEPAIRKRLRAQRLWLR